MSKHPQHYRSEFLDLYLRMVEDTEPPRIYHAWSALTGIAACLGRKAWTPWGPDKLFANLYVLLVGSPAARKSTAMGIMKKIVMKNTNIRFAQDDCSGKRQGIISLMVGDDFDEDEISIGKQMENLILTPETLADIEVDLSTKKQSQPDEDKHVIMVASTEFNNFIGHGNIEFLEFLSSMYDGEPYKYQLKNAREKMTMSDPLITLIGCTTPTNIATAMPAAAIGAGFMSRSILVHGTNRYKDLETFPPLPEEYMEEVSRIYSEIYWTFKGEFTRTKDAAEFSEFVYRTPLALNDGRFLHYISRRHTHFRKLSMVFAATRLDHTINLEDVTNAHSLLEATEKHMPDALGEYGLNPISAAKQKIVDFITYAKEPVTFAMLQQFMHRDLKTQDIAACLNDLVGANKIQRINSTIYGSIAFIPMQTVNPEILELMDKQTNAPTTEITQ